MRDRPDPMEPGPFLARALGRWAVPANRLAGRVALVTGAGRGIGRAIAFALGGEGASVVAAARTAPEVCETVSLVQARGGSAVGVACDVAEAADVTNLVKRALREFGTIDVLVNNAGIQGPIGPLVENDLAAWIQTVNVNLVGTCLCCRAVLPGMIQQRHGKIVNLSGGGAAAPRPFYSAYAASKAAVVRLTETLAEEVREFDVQVNAISPGAVNTRMLEETLAAGPAAGEKAAAEAQRQAESGGTPPELAAALVVFLASSESDGITGKLITALHDGWQSWDGAHFDELASDPWLTLRRLDEHTLRPLLARLLGEQGKGKSG